MVLIKSLIVHWLFPTGVYVEKVGDGRVEGLLGVGDEILQVNGEAVAGLSLDQVTRLMTRESTATLRILPARRNQRWTAQDRRGTQPFPSGRTVSH